MLRVALRTLNHIKYSIILINIIMYLIGTVEKISILPTASGVSK